MSHGKVISHIFRASIRLYFSFQVPAHLFFLSSLPQKVPMGMVSESKCSFPPNSSCLEEEKRSSVGERRREGRYKTFDWAEYSHMQKKREMLSRQAGIESELVCDDFVPPAPASSPEDPASFIAAVNSETGQAPHVTKPLDTSPLMVRSSIVASKPNDRRSAEVDGVDVFKDVSNAQMKEKVCASYSHGKRRGIICIMGQCNKPLLLIKFNK